MCVLLIHGSNVSQCGEYIYYKYMYNVEILILEYFHYLLFSNVVCSITNLEANIVLH